MSLFLSNGMDSVDRHIEHHLAQLGLIAQERRPAKVQVDVQLHVVRTDGAHHLHHPAKGLPGVQALVDGLHILSAQGGQLLDDLLTVSGGLGDLLGTVVKLGVLGQVQ